MKINTLLLLLCASVARLAAADILSADTAVFLQPDPKSHVLVRLKSGNTIIYTGDAPAGWRRVEITGSFEGYAHNRDVTKGLEVRAGASILTAPKKDAPALTVAQTGDKTEVTGLVDNAPDWCQIKIEKKIQGFIATSANANTPAEVKPAYAVATPAAPARPPILYNGLARGVGWPGGGAGWCRLDASRKTLTRCCDNWSVSARGIARRTNIGITAKAGLPLVEWRQRRNLTCIAPAITGCLR